MTLKQTFSNPRRMFRYINIFYLTLVLIFIGNIIIGLSRGTREIDCLWNSGLLLFVIGNSWILALRPFARKIDEQRARQIK